MPGLKTISVLVVSFAMPLFLSQAEENCQQARLKIDQTRLDQVNKQVQIYTKVRRYFLEWQQTNRQIKPSIDSVTNMKHFKEVKRNKIFNR
jgi:hypothetical protein